MLTHRDDAPTLFFSQKAPAISPILMTRAARGFFAAVLKLFENRSL
jgi:hypothetical protein